MKDTINDEENIRPKPASARISIFCVINMLGSIPMEKSGVPSVKKVIPDIYTELTIS